MRFPLCKNALEYICVVPTGEAYSAPQNTIVTITFCSNNLWKSMPGEVWEFFSHTFWPPCI